MKQYKINNVTLSETELRKLIKENPELKEDKKDGWELRLGSYYWYITDWGSINRAAWYRDIYDLFRSQSGNCYKTEEEARQALKRIEAINIVTLAIEELNEGWIPDWEDFEGKFDIFYNYEDCLFQAGHSLGTKNATVIPTIKSEKIAQQIIKDYEEELKIIFEIN